MAFVTGSVTAVLDAKIRDFQNKLNKAQKDLNNFANDMNKNMGKGLDNVQSKFGSLIGQLQNQAIPKFASFAGVVGSSLKEASNSVFNFVNNTLGSLIEKAKLAGLALGGIGIVAGVMGVRTAGQLETARSALIGLLGSAEEADKTLNRIKREASATPFELVGLTEGVKQLSSVTETGDQAIDILMNVGKAITASGGSQEELDRVVFNLKQIQGLGELSMIDLKELRRAIPIFDDLVEASGTTVEEIRNAEDPAQALFDVFEKGGKNIKAVDEAFSNQAGNFQQLMSNMIDALDIFLSEFVVQTGIFDLVKSGLQSFVNYITNDEVAGTGIFDLIKNGLQSFVNYIKNNKDVIIQFVLDLKQNIIELAEQAKVFYDERIVPIINFIRENQTAFESLGISIMIAVGALYALNLALSILAILTSPITLVIVGITALTFAIVHLWRTNETFREIIIGIWEFLKTYFQSWFAIVRTLFNGFVTNIRNTWEMVKTVLKGFIDFFVGIWQGDFDKAIGGLKTAWGGVETYFKNTVENIKNTISGIIEPIKNAIEKFDELKGKAGLNTSKNDGKILGIPGTGFLADKFADGGIVGGNSFTGDKLLVGINSGEMVLNAEQQTGLFNLIKSLGNQKQNTMNNTFNINGGQAGIADQIASVLARQNRLANNGVNL